MRRNIKKTIVYAGSKKMPGLEVPLTLEVAKAMRMVRRHFRIIAEPSPDVVFEATRYDGWWNFADVSVNMALRLENYISVGGSVVAGSGYLSDKPWALFGEMSPGDQAEYKFSYFDDLVEHYENALKNPNVTDCEIPFEQDIINLVRIADRYSESLQHIISVCFLLTRDLIFHCGPDSDMFFDLFTNDSRDNPESIDLDYWEANRCKLFGRFGGIKSRSSYQSQPSDEDYNYSVAYPLVCYQKPVKRKNRKCEATLEFVSRNAPLFEGIPICNIE